MKRKKALVASVSAAALALTLAACGGGDGDKERRQRVRGVPDDRRARTPRPRVLPRRSRAPRTGGEVTVLAPDPDDGPTSLDPAGLWSVTDNGIAQDLLFRSLTTFRQNPRTAQYELVPDLATDLGTPNEDYTEWTFTLKEGIKWENGDPVTAEEVAFGIKRSFDADTFATGPGTAYSKPYFEGGEEYNGPYAERADGVPGDRGRRQRHSSLNFGTPFAGDGLLRASSRRSARCRSTRTAADYGRRRCRPVPTRSRSTSRTRSWSWSRTTSGTRKPTRPAASSWTSTRSSSVATRPVADKTVAQRRRHTTIVDRHAVARTTTRRSRTDSTTRSWSARSRARAS